MQVTIPPELEALVQQRLETGRYNTPIEVLIAGVALLGQQEEIHQGRFPEAATRKPQGLVASLVGIAKTNEPAPNDDEVAAMLDERLAQKYL
jgi:antitoxin ParD1/3/4